MSDVKVITMPSLEGKRRALVLVEDRIGHYPEFRTFFANAFDLDRIGLREPGYLAASSGTEYALVSSAAAASPFQPGSRSVRSSRHWSRSTSSWSTATSGKSCAG